MRISSRYGSPLCFRELVPWEYPFWTLLTVLLFTFAFLHNVLPLYSFNVFRNIWLGHTADGGSTHAWTLLCFFSTVRSHSLLHPALTLPWMYQRRSLQSHMVTSGICPISSPYLDSNSVSALPHPSSLSFWSDTFFSNLRKGTWEVNIVEIFWDFFFLHDLRCKMHLFQMWLNRELQMENGPPFLPPCLWLLTSLMPFGLPCDLGLTPPWKHWRALFWTVMMVSHLCCYSLCWALWEMS